MTLNELLRIDKRDAFILPQYQNGSIANIPHTVSKMLGASFSGLPALDVDKWYHLSGQVERVILLILDGFGLNLYNKLDPNLLKFDSEDQITDSITSIFPSTTVAALSSLWTGVGANQHGMLGLKMFFPEYATAGQMLKLSPVFQSYPDALVKAGLTADTFLQFPGFAEQLEQAGVRSVSFKGKEIIHSALSKMHGRGITEEYGVTTFAEMMVNLRVLLESTQGEMLYVNGYWPTVDTLSHLYTWRHDAVSVELHNLIHLIKGELVNKLSRTARKNTVLFLVADHGQTVSPSEKRIYLAEHPTLANMLFMRPIGEPRVLYLYAKQGLQTAVIQYINENLGHAFIAVSGQEALANGLFGLGAAIPEAEQRVSDVVVIAKDGYTLLLESERELADRMNGRHASLTADEMEVPWLGYRLG